MNKDKAKSILNEIRMMDESFGKLSGLVHGIPDETERKFYAKRLGDIIGKIYTEIMLPIIQDYPDLDPDKE